MCTETSDTMSQNTSYLPDIVISGILHSNKKLPDMHGHSRIIPDS
jgi:hypothetical protein